MNKQILALLIAASLAGISHNAAAENLLQVYQRAKSYDAQFKAQESGHLAILEKKQQALAANKPQVNLSGKAEYSASRNSVTDNTNDGESANYTLQLNKSLFNKSINANIAKTDALLGQSKAALESSRQDLIMRVADAYFNALMAQDSLNFASAEKAAISRQLEQTTAYFEAGRSAITDVKEAESSYAAAIAQEITATQQLDVAREQLRVITGGFYQSLNAPRSNMPLTMPAPNSIEAWVNTAKQNNHLLRASKHAVTAAQKEVETQRAEKFPRVDLYANHSGSYLDDDIVNSRKINGAAVGLNMSVPLYTGGATSSRIREARHKLQQSQQEGDLQARMTEQQARSAFLSVQSSISQVKANQQALSSAETAAEATQAGFEVGTRTAVDVLNSLRSVFRAQRDYASARYSYLQNNLALRQAAGTLSEKDVVAINAFLTESPKAVVSKPQADVASAPAADNIAVTPKQSKTASEPVEDAPTAAEPAPETGAESFEYYVMPGTSK